MTPARTSTKSGAGTTEPPDSRSGENRPSGIHPASRRRGRRAKWTVVKQFEQGGHRYQLRSQPLEQRGETASLTEREEEVLTCALDGHSNKSIAYELGVAPSTVGVLLFRAAAKLGVKSRRDLLSAYARRQAAAGMGAHRTASSSSGVPQALVPRVRDGVGSGVERGPNPAQQGARHERRDERHDHHHGEQLVRDDAEIQPDVQDD